MPKKQNEPLPSFLYCAREPHFEDEYVLFRGHPLVKSPGPCLFHVVDDPEAESHLRFDLVDGSYDPEEWDRLHLLILGWYLNWIQYASTAPLPEGG